MAGRCTTTTHNALEHDAGGVAFVKVNRSAGVSRRRTGGRRHDDVGDLRHTRRRRGREERRAAGLRERGRLAVELDARRAREVRTGDGHVGTAAGRARRREHRVDDRAAAGERSERVRRRARAAVVAHRPTGERPRRIEVPAELMTVTEAVSVASL